MGRQPIGKVAMSGAERQRRYQRKLAEGYDIGPLKAHIRELKAELARSAKQRADGCCNETQHGIQHGRWHGPYPRAGSRCAPAESRAGR